MKRLITLSLAALMVLSLSAVAFAADTWSTISPVGTPNDAASAIGVKALSTDIYYSDRDFDETNDDLLYKYGEKVMAPGMTLYIPLLTTGNAIVDSKDAVKSLKISTKAQTGAEYIESYRIEYKKFEDTKDYGYVLAIKLKDRADTGRKNYAAEITLKKSSGNDGDGKSFVCDMTYRVGFTIAYGRNRTIISKYPVVVDYFNSSKDGQTTLDTEVTIDFKDTDGVYFEVDIFQQTRIIAAMNNKYQPELAAKFPAANLDFYNGNGAIFAKIGVLSIPGDAGSFIYAIDADGVWTKVEAEYDDGEEMFKVNTRVMGQYVVADQELDLSVLEAAPEGEPTPEAPVDAPVKENVPTGAAA